MSKPLSDELAVSLETVGSLMGGRLFQPASIQRDFNWETANCVALFEDIYRVFTAHYVSPDGAIAPPEASEPVADGPKDDADDDEDEALSGVAPVIDVEIEGPPDTYLLGPMYLGPPSNGVSELFDGLQRITSLTLLVSVMRDLVAEDAPEWGDWLHGFVEDSEWGYRLTYPTKSHKETGTARWLHEFAQTRGETLRARRNAESRSPRGRIVRAIRQFRTLAEDLDLLELTAFAEFLLSRVRIVVIEIAEPRLARQAFVTSNQRGVPLSPVDILKGVLMDIAGDDTRARQVKEYWDRISQTPDLEGFMSAVDYIERRAQQGPSHLVELGDYLTEARPGFAILEWMEQMEQLSRSWVIMKSALADPAHDPFHGDLWRLGLLNWAEWRPLALHFVHVHDNALCAGQTRRATTVEKRFDLFHRRAMGVTLAGLNAKARHAIISRAIEQSEGLTGDGRVTNCMSLNSGALRLKSNQKQRALRQLSTGFEDREARASLIRWLESMHWPRGKAPGYISAGTVEHILPLTPAPAATQWQADFPDNEIRLGLCNTLGNFILIDRETNGLAGSRDFADKVALYRKMTRNYAMAAEVCALDRWTPETIMARSERLRDLITRELRWDQIEANDAPGDQVDFEDA